MTVRRAEAVELRAAGLSYRQIANRLGVDVAVAHRDVRKALKVYAERESVAVESARELEARRLDHALQQVARVLADDAIDHDVRLRAVDRLVRISESRRRLLGLDVDQSATVAVDGRTVTFNIQAMPQAGENSNATQAIQGEATALPLHPGKGADDE